MFIYVIVNSETLKIYIGQHKGTNLRQYLQQKWSEAQHRISARSILYASMRKHPRESWSIHPLISNLQTRAECDCWEKLLIKVLNARHPDVGYNICRGGEGFTGEFTKESRQKMSESHKKEWAGRSPEKREAARAGSIKSGRKAKENKTGIHALTHEQKQDIGRRGGAAAGRIAVKSGQLASIRTHDNCVKGGQAAGQKNKENGQLDRIRNLPQATAARQRTAATAIANKTGLFALTLDQNREFGHQGATIGHHRRWHAARGITNPKCELCILKG